MKKLAALILSAGFVTFVQAKAEAACGKIEVAKGDVKIETGGKSVKASVGSKICSGDTIVAAADSRAKIKMDDGNELNISPDSKIALEKYEFNPAENKKKVLLNVLKGKVRAATKEENMYNDKASDGQANTFQVKTKSAVAGVRGTDFLTGFNPSTNKAEIVTFKGKVDVGQAGPGGQILNPVSVGAGQKTEATVGQAPAPPKAVPKAEMEKMNTETKADTGGGSKDPAGGPAAKGEEKKEDSGSGEDKAAGDSEAKSDDKKADAKSDEKQASDEKKSDDKKSDDKKADAKSEDNKSDDKKADAKSEEKKPDDKKSDDKKADAKSDERKSEDKKPDAKSDDKKADAKSDSKTDDKKVAAEPKPDDRKAPADAKSEDKSASGDKKPPGGGSTASNNNGSGSSPGDSKSSPPPGGGPAAGQPPPRAPASIGSGSMLNGGDLGGGAGFGGGASIPKFPTGGGIPTVAVPTLPPAIPKVPVCDYCNQTAIPTTTKLKVNIEYKK